MSGKLDQSLDTIMTERRKSARTRRPRRNPASKTAAPAPVGGIKKTTKPAKNAEKIATPVATHGSGESKIIVSNLVSCSVISTDKMIC
jgi:THO complex subunit 4